MNGDVTLFHVTRNIAYMFDQIECFSYMLNII